MLLNSALAQRAFLKARMSWFCICTDLLSLKDAVFTVALQNVSKSDVSLEKGREIEWRDKAKMQTSSTGISLDISRFHSLSAPAD
jgi:hypothetical protein